MAVFPVIDSFHRSSLSVAIHPTASPTLTVLFPLLLCTSAAVALDIVLYIADWVLISISISLFIFVFDHNDLV